MAKAIDQMDLETAKQIHKWLLNSSSTSESDIKREAREYCRSNKLSLEAAQKKVQRETSFMPKRIF
jgi:hypothetical protein